jgi:N-acyl homoserine lactone hydrolase
MAKYTIRPLNTGYTSSDKKTYIYHHSTHPYRNAEGKMLLPCFAFLVEGEKGPILVDTGMSNTERASKYHHPGSNQPDGFAIHDRLANLGIMCGDVRLIILTHMHWDHTFYMEKFVNARFVASRIEYEFALNPIPVYYKSYEHPILGFRRPFEGIKIDVVDGEKEIVEGIRVFPTPGHSPGHQSVEIDTGEGKYICCGDAIFIYDNLDPVPEIHYSITPPARYANVVESWKSIELLKARAKAKEFLLPCHEPAVEKRIEKQPVLGR